MISDAFISVYIFVRTLCTALFAYVLKHVITDICHSTHTSVHHLINDRAT